MTALDNRHVVVQRAEVSRSNAGASATSDSHPSPWAIANVSNIGIISGRCLLQLPVLQGEDVGHGRTIVITGVWVTKASGGKGFSVQPVIVE